MKFSRYIFIICFIISFSKLRAQEVIPTYSDYLTDNLYLLHPSMAGASNFNKLRLTARQQWFDVNNAPALQTLSGHGRLTEKIGVGGIVFNDQNGNFSKRGVYATFAYHLLFSRSELDLNQLSFGLSGGIIQHSLDQSNFTVFDPVLGNNMTDLYGNLDVGLSYYYLDFFAHLTGKNLLSLKRDIFFSDAVPGNMRNYMFSTGYVITPSGGSWSYEPSLLFQWREHNDERLVDLNMKFYRPMESALIFGGLSYRVSFDGAEYTTTGEEVRRQHLQYFTPFAGIEYNRFLFAYTFSHQANSIVISNSGFHQLTLGYNFGENRARYNCKCPAINQKSR